MSEQGTPPRDEITPEAAYLNRRAFLAVGITAATAAATAILYRRLTKPAEEDAKTTPIADLVTATSPASESPTASATESADSGFRVDEPLTAEKSITHYNNFYEFSLGKEEVAGAAANFKTDGWKVSVGGMVSKPRTFDLDDVRKISRPEERIYRMRCVEAWSMVIPWAGFSLSRLLAKVEPTSSAKYVAFETLLDPQRMPNQTSTDLPWPYVEGLRIDEAMHPLTLLASGLYGKTLPPQDGAPVRLVVPWKYGFKGIKSIVKITLTDKQPPTTWNIQAPNEYGFYASVNPHVDHPRWSQATENRIGVGRRDTLMFNGYGEQVAGLYSGMDLTANF